MSTKHHYTNQLSFHSKVLRLFWEFTFILLFRPTPRWLFNSWRIFLLRIFGAKIGKDTNIHPSCRFWAPWNLTIGDYVGIAHGVDCYTVDSIYIGNRVTISQRAFLCTGSHDTSTLNIPLVHKPIFIEDHVWICAEAYISPGIRIGEGSVIAAGSVVVKDVAPWVIVGGNPAKFIKKRILSS